ncbi:MAG: hypothetical protein JWM75_1768 [Sphingomonas bacterium]|nr:hypothetical protein [Sphingomonas bacterium]
MDQPVPPTIAVLSAGAMGSAIAARLVEHGAVVLTSLDGRSAATAARARAAGMIDAPVERLVAADIILSILPPADALPLARMLAGPLRASPRTLYIDCNALSPDTKRQVAALIEASGCTMIDGAIIGMPPGRGTTGPALYVSGDPTGRAAMLATLGIDLRVIDGPVGAAAALKMSYAGINKGMVGLAAAMMLAASRAGAADALHDELAASLPDHFTRFQRAVPDMYPKAYRWIAEMREIAAFAGDEATAMIFEGMARLYERLAADIDGDNRERRMLDAFLRRPPPD